MQSQLPSLVMQPVTRAIALPAAVLLYESNRDADLTISTLWINGWCTQMQQASLCSYASRHHVQQVTCAPCRTALWHCREHGKLPNSLCHIASCCFHHSPALAAAAAEVSEWAEAVTLTSDCTWDHTDAVLDGWVWQTLLHPACKQMHAVSNNCSYKQKGWTHVDHAKQMGAARTSASSSCCEHRCTSSSTSSTRTRLS